MKEYIYLLIVIALFLGGPFYVLFSGKLVLDQHWSGADRSAIGVAPDPKLNGEAIVQIYAARAYNWRGMFAVHTWVALKPKSANKYTIYQVLGWNKYWNKPVLEVFQGKPDRKWFGHKPEVLYEKRGGEAEKIIQEVQKTSQKYPYKHNYHFWPGPNSNTFVAYVIRHSPSIKLRLPLTAIGKDYDGDSVCSSALSKTGYQCSLKGLLGFIIAKVEGIEINILGFSFGVNFSFPFIHLPGVD